MLTFSAAQMALLAERQTARFVDDCAAVLRARHPAETAGQSNAEMQTHVEALMTKLKTLGFGCAGDMAQAIQLIFAFHLKPGRPAMPASLTAQLRSRHVSVEKKIEALEQLFLFDAD